MNYKKIAGIEIYTKSFKAEVAMLTKEDLDSIESNLRFEILDEDGDSTYYVLKDDIVYRYPLEDDDDDSEEDEIEEVEEESHTNSIESENTF